MDNTDEVIVRGKIKKLIKDIGECRRQIEDKGKAKAQAKRNYNFRMAIATSELKYKETYELAGREYPKPPTTLCDRIAKGICAIDEENLDIAESAYKACISNLEALKSQLNAFQSIYRHLDET